MRLCVVTHAPWPQHPHIHIYIFIFFYIYFFIYIYIAWRFGLLSAHAWLVF